MQILKYMLGVMLVLLAVSPSFAYKTLDDLKFDTGGNCFIRGDNTGGDPGTCLTETWKSLKPGMWGVPGLDDKTQVDIIGNSVCVDYRGKQKEGQVADNQSYFDKPSHGQYCYCQMTGPETSSWIFAYGYYKDYEDCNYECASTCGKAIIVDRNKIRTNMFATVDYGGGSSGGDDYSWLYDTTGTAKSCYVKTDGGFEDNGCPSGTDKIVTEQRQWAAVLDGKEQPQTIVTGTAWVSDIIDTDKYDVGYIPTDPEVIRDINKEYASYTSGDDLYGYCYCKMETPGESSWVLGNYNERYLGECIYDCANTTSRRGHGSVETTFTNAMFSTLKSAAGGMSMTVTTRDYVDGLFGGKQTQITQTGTNKLMTFGAGTGAPPGSRDIVSTLGTSTSAPTVPETGPIVAGMGLKQNQLLSDMANYVVMGTGTAGFVGRKPIYTATNNYDTALVTAGTINTVAAAAANSELTCTRHIDGAAQTDANCLLWGINTTAPTGTLTFMSFNPDVSVNGTSQCYRRLRTIYAGDSDGVCNVDTVSYLGASLNLSGKWGTVFPYGDVSGISVCSAVSASTMGAIATDAQSVTMDSEYAAQAGVGESALENNQTYCWCKMENPATSPWVYNRNNSDSNSCASNCAFYCSSNAASAVALRSALFGI